MLYKPCLLDPFFQTLVAIPSRKVVLCHIPRAEVSHGMVEQMILNHYASVFELEILKPEIDPEWTFPEECPEQDLTLAKLYVLTRIDMDH